MHAHTSRVKSICAVSFGGIDSALNPSPTAGHVNEVLLLARASSSICFCRFLVPCSELWKIVTPFK
jgi:hypothetical protein